MSPDGGSLVFSTFLCGNGTDFPTALPSIGNPPASAAPGKAFAITDTVKNQGATTAALFTTRFYLSLDAAKDAGDARLTGSRAVATLAAGAQSAGTTTVTIPLTAPPGTYRLLACADDTLVVAEASDANNCRAAAATIVVGRPDLVETAVSNPPAAARPGTSFAVTDTVRNQGTRDCERLGHPLLPLRRRAEEPRRQAADGVAVRFRRWRPAPRPLRP